MSNGQDETEKPPPNGTNNTDNDEIDELPSKERLERLKLQAETYALKKPFLTKLSVIWTIITVVLTIALFVATGYFSDWFSVRLKKLENKKILVDAETKILEYNKSLLTQDTEKIKIEKEKLVTKKNKLTLETKTLKLEKASLEDKKVKLEEEYERKFLALKEELKAREKDVDNFVLSFMDYMTKNVKDSIKETIIETNVLSKEALSELTNKINQFNMNLDKAKVRDIYTFNNWYSRGAGEYLDRKYNDAISSFETALENKPGPLAAAYTHSYIGRAYFRLGNYPASFVAFKEAFELYITLNELDNALQCFNEMLIVFKGMNIDDKKSFKDDIDQLQEQLIEAKNKGTTK